MFDIRWGIAFAGKSFANGRDKARDAVLGDPNLRGALLVETCAALPSLSRRSESRAARAVERY